MKSYNEFILESTMTVDSALAVLSLSSNYTEGDLKKAYRAASIKAHPDRGGSTEHMQKVNAAKAVLDKQMGTSSTKSSIDWAAFADMIEKSMKSKLDSASFTKYVTDLFSEPIESVIKFSKDRYYVSVKMVFSNLTKDKYLSAHMSVYLASAYNEASSLGSSSKDFYAVSVQTEFFANNRKQTIIKKGYDLRHDKNLFIDPRIIFPKDKIIKGLSNTKTKFTKKDMDLALKTKLGAKYIGNDVYHVPISADVSVYISRGTFLRTPYFYIHGLVYTNGSRGKLPLPKVELTSFYENEKSLSVFESMIKELSHQTEKNWPKTFEKYKNKFKEKS